MLGSASLELTVEERRAQKKVVVFSGDIGPRGAPLHRDPVPFEHADLVFMESTYGDQRTSVAGRDGGRRARGRARRPSQAGRESPRARLRGRPDAIAAVPAGRGVQARDAAAVPDLSSTARWRSTRPSSTRSTSSCSTTKRWPCGGQANCRQQSAHRAGSARRPTTRGRSHASQGPCMVHGRRGHVHGRPDPAPPAEPSAATRRPWC